MTTPTAARTVPRPPPGDTGAAIGRAGSPRLWPRRAPDMRRDEQAAIAAVTAAQKALAKAGHDLDPLTVAAALAAADTAAAGEHMPAAGLVVAVTGRVGGGTGRYAVMARETAAIFAAAAETYLQSAAKNYVEQDVTGRDGTRYVITFRRPDGRSADELLTTAEAALNRLTTAILRFADQLEISAGDSRVLSVRSALREVSASLRRIVRSGSG